MPKKYPSLPHRLVENSIYVHNLDLEVGCWLWQGYCQKSYITKRGSPGSYGRINLIRDGVSSKLPVHRVAKVLYEITELKPEFDFYKKEDKKLFFNLYRAYSVCGLTIDHLCGNTLCWNPSHLEWVYLSNNQRRKKWDIFRKVERVKFIVDRLTRHQASMYLTNDVRDWTYKISRRRYRKVT